MNRVFQFHDWRFVMRRVLGYAICGSATVFLALTPVAQAADDVVILPSRVGDLGNVVIDSQINTFKSNLTVVLAEFKCFGTNLRSVSNPLSPTSTISMRMTLAGSDGSDRDVVLDFPAKWVQPYFAGIDAGSVDLVSAPPGTRVLGIGGFLKLEIDDLYRVPLGATGDFNIADKNKILKGVRFFQTLDPSAPTGKYMGTDGPLSARVRWQTSPSNGHITLSASFPGQNQFCGGYFSPLMVFFDEKRPSFTGQSSFALTDVDAKYYWPEKNAPGSFLALDRNKDGRISDGKELFGDSDQFENGFLALAELDTNKDGVIDAKDPNFDQLVLWTDANSNGVSEKRELKPLKDKKITSVSLKYQNVREAFADRAEYKQKSQFTFLDDKGKAKTGDVLDIYFYGVQTAPPPLAQQKVREPAKK
ncbi:MAG: EF-hand domain-containing protein [Bdellovibrionaceae bacterium]|nr:EF-hand domain-containing protein [Pseudobdellovibrionaceae bacterium]